MAAEPRDLPLGLAAFGGAFLIFAVQPLLAKWLLPALGGSPATWASCMLFFQGMLVFGYALAQLRSRVVYAALVLSALVAAVLSRELPPPPLGLDRSPVWYVLGVLLARVGLPYLALSSVAPRVSRWAAGSAPRLYAVSNAGSLAALLAYPTLIEPALNLQRQWLVWSLAAALLAALLAYLSLSRRTLASTEDAEPRTLLPLTAAGAELWRALRSRALPLPAQIRAAFSQRGRWLAYAAVPCALLLATTNYLTTDIAAVPLLWVVPLAVYLLTFIAAFGGGGRRLWRTALGVFLVTSAASGWNTFAPVRAPLWSQLTVSLLALGSAGLVCHMELVRARPSRAELGEYYVCIALGGALGSAAVAVIAPLVFSDYYELELSVLATYVVLVTRRKVEAVSESDIAGLRRPLERSLSWFGLGLCGPMLLLGIWLRAYGLGREGQVIERQRNFLGAIRVTQLEVGRVLTHGRIRHGMQLAGPELRRLPTMYYGPGTAIQRVFERHKPRTTRRIGVVGLGAGTLAALGHSQDTMRFYELDPQVLAVASSRFTFLKDSPAHIETQLGDGRLALARETGAPFDILVLDAFASDSVPVHLLTREAFAVYLARLAPDGVLLANVANRHISVDRVVRGAALAQGLACGVVETDQDAALFVSKVRWAVCARNGEQVAWLLDGMERAPEPLPDVVWTDARASLWPVLH